MKDKIIEILNNNTETAELINSGVYADVIEDGKFENIAQEIVKLFAIPVVVGQSEQLSCECKDEWIEHIDNFTDRMQCKKCSKSF